MEFGSPEKISLCMKPSSSIFNCIFFTKIMLFHFGSGRLQFLWFKAQLVTQQFLYRHASYLPTRIAWNAHALSRHTRSTRTVGCTPSCWYHLFMLFLCCAFLQNRAQNSLCTVITYYGAHSFSSAVREKSSQTHRKPEQMSLLIEWAESM